MNQLKAKIKRNLDWIYIEFNWWLFGPYNEVFDNDQVYYNSEDKIYNLIKNSYPNVIFAYKKAKDINWNDIKFLHIIDIQNKKDIHLKFEILNYIYSDLINKTIIINIDNKKITINQRTLDIINEEIEEIVEISILNKDILYKLYNISLNDELIYKIKEHIFFIKNKENMHIISKVWKLNEKDFIFDLLIQKKNNIWNRLIVWMITLLSFIFIIELILLFDNSNIDWLIITFIPFLLLSLLIKTYIKRNTINFNTFLKAIINKNKLIIIDNEIKYINSNYKKLSYNNINKYFNILIYNINNLKKEEKIIIFLLIWSPILILLINIFPTLWILLPILILFLSRLFKN